MVNKNVTHLEVIKFAIFFIYGANNDIIYKHIWIYIYSK